jgi:hypothetical protein
MEVLSSTPIKQSFKSPITSCNMCTVTAKTRNISGNAPTMDDSLSSIQTKHCHSYRVVPSTSSCITPVKYNMTTIKQVPSILTNWPHFLSYNSASSSVSLQQSCPHLGYNIAQAPSFCSGINPLSPKLNPICYLLALLAHDFLNFSRIRVKSLTLRLLM